MRRLIILSIFFLSGVNAFAQFRAETDSASAPSFQWNGDANTGLWHPATGAVGITASGAERVRINTTGVGIGTSTPARLLQVAGPIRITPTTLPGSPAAGDLAFDSAAANTLKFYNGTAWQSVTTGSGFALAGANSDIISLNALTAINGASISIGNSATTTLNVGSASTGNLTAVFGANTGTSTTTLRSGTGGTTVSTTGTGASAINLSVAGTNGGIQLTPNGTGIVTSTRPLRITPTTLPAAPAAGTVAFDSAAANSLKYFNGTVWTSVGTGMGDFMANGTVVMTGTIKGLAGTAAAPGFTFNGDTDNGMFRPTTNVIAFSTAGTESMRILANGNVGIGTTSPNASAILDLASTSKGFLPPRMTSTERDAIATPATGLMVFNTTDNEYNVYNGTAWNTIGGLGFGPRVARSMDTVYTAATDGIVSSAIYASSAASRCSLEGKTDATATPTAVVARDVAGYNSTYESYYAGVTFAVKKGDKWWVDLNVDYGTCASAVVSWLPITPVTGGASDGVQRTGDTMTGPLELPLNGLTVGTSQMVLASGNVGIGTTTPATELDVNGYLTRKVNRATGTTAFTGTSGNMTGRTLTFTKKSASTDLLIQYSDTFGAQGGNASSGITCRYEIRIDGAACSQQLYQSVYVFNTTSATAVNISPGTISGYCSSVAAGSRTITVTATGTNATNCYGSYGNAPWMLTVEEIR